MSLEDRFGVPHSGAVRFRWGVGLVLALAGLLFAAGCSGDDDGTDRVLPTPRPAPTVAGQSVDGFAPGLEDRVAIIGVERGGSAPMRALPGIDQPVIAEIPPTANNLFGFGEAFQTPDLRLWWLVRYESAQGWIEPGAAYLGASEDVSVRVAGTLSSTNYPTFGALIAEVETQYGNTVIVDITPESESGAVLATVDALDGDAIRVGSRVVLTGQSSDSGYQLVAAIEFALCGRGVDEAGACQ